MANAWSTVPQILIDSDINNNTRWSIVAVNGSSDDTAKNPRFIDSGIISIQSMNSTTEIINTLISNKISTFSNPYNAVLKIANPLITQYIAGQNYSVDSNGISTGTPFDTVYSNNIIDMQYWTEFAPDSTLPQRVTVALPNWWQDGAGNLDNYPDAEVVCVGMLKQIVNKTIDELEITSYVEISYCLPENIIMGPDGIHEIIYVNNVYEHVTLDENVEIPTGMKVINLVEVDEEDSENNKVNETVDVVSYVNVNNDPILSYYQISRRPKYEPDEPEVKRSALLCSVNGIHPSSFNDTLSTDFDNLYLGKHSAIDQMVKSLRVNYTGGLTELGNFKICIDIQGRITPLGPVPDSGGILHLNTKHRGYEEIVFQFGSLSSTTNTNHYGYAEIILENYKLDTEDYFYVTLPNDISLPTAWQQSDQFLSWKFELWQIPETEVTNYLNKRWALYTTPLYLLTENMSTSWLPLMPEWSLFINLANKVQQFIDYGFYYASVIGSFTGFQDPSMIAPLDEIDPDTQHFMGLNALLPENFPDNETTSFMPFQIGAVNTASDPAIFKYFRPEEVGLPRGVNVLSVADGTFANGSVPNGRVPAFITQGFTPENTINIEVRAVFGSHVSLGLDTPVIPKMDVTAPANLQPPVVWYPFNLYSYTSRVPAIYLFSKNDIGKTPIMITLTRM